MAVEVTIGREATSAANLASMNVPGRLAQLRERLGKERIDGILVTSLANVRYLSGFSGSAALLVVTARRALLITDGRYRDQAAAETAAAGVDVDLEVVGATKQVQAVETATSNLARLALEAKAVSWELQAQFAATLKPELVATSGLVEAIRLVKDAGEIDRIERACDIADVAFAQTKGLLAQGVTEAEFAAELEFEMRRRGAAQASFETIVASGPNGAMPHAQPTGRVISPGDLVVVDFGAVVDGYHSDMTRTVCVGEPSAADISLLDAVAASQRAGLVAVVAGVTGGAVDEACRKSLGEAGLAEAFTHSTGHGVGLEVHEAPTLAAGSEENLAEGSVVTVEPGVYLEERGGVRIEDTVVVTRTGCRPLTKTTKDFLL
ncbi:MAG TPA: Xaa-Pro peptidase family protein [Acidimicrobiales bacterium]|nr:Xaa-Pro peptidase family protein [Acidimicrobiales bacterium]